ncbi:unnamed protein product [Sphagnum jensenii]|uniref:RRM domain-containing protein n=1 Tax=Sphagnum jensenii TaxID=128206 RepID=A0ABP1BJU9_9BRYO
MVCEKSFFFYGISKHTIPKLYASATDIACDGGGAGDQRRLRFDALSKDFLTSLWEKPEELIIAAEQQESPIPIAAAVTHLIMHAVVPLGIDYNRPQSSNGLVEQPRQQGPPGANLFLFRIPDDFTDENLKETFAPFGNVINARVGVERESGRNRGLASAESAIQGLNNVPVGGRRLKVERKRGEENGIQQAYQQQQAY